MLIRQAAFYLGRSGLETWQAEKLRKLCTYFHASVSLFNVSQCCRVPLENSLKVMAAGNKPGDFCLLFIEGMDAELAHLVLLDYISEHFKIFQPEQDFNFVQHAGVECFFHLLTAADFTRQAVIDKNTLLREIGGYIKMSADSCPAGELFLLREKHAATVMGPQVALPHIMTELITVPSIILASLPEPLDWHSPRGPVRCIIAAALPKPASVKMIRAFTNLSKKLVDENICRLFVDAPAPLQSAMLAAMLSGQGKNQ
ncbi:PTS sugar transporter subunit IIA [Psychromonas aquimarina]|uniref:PTS sugar transporter subunit IIA n=1 Tax=Psychromonas aquimarina TaxID=444919 RepID=UPI00048D7BC8|nr:PTS sugar transporter subunit IIA [Psychromonas aquimarina]